MKLRNCLMAILALVTLGILGIIGSCCYIASTIKTLSGPATFDFTEGHLSVQIPAGWNIKYGSLGGRITTFTFNSETAPIRSMQVNTLNDDKRTPKDYCLDIDRFGDSLHRKLDVRNKEVHRQEGSLEFQSHPAYFVSFVHEYEHTIPDPVYLNCIRVRPELLVIFRGTSRPNSTAEGDAALVDFKNLMQNVTIK